jgi:hypothetical protein
MASARSSGWASPSQPGFETLRPSAKARIEDHPHARRKTLGMYLRAHGFDDAGAIASWNQAACRQRDVESPADHASRTLLSAETRVFADFVGW